MVIADDRTPLPPIEDNPADQRLLEHAAPGRFLIEPASRLAMGLDALHNGRFVAVNPRPLTLRLQRSCGDQICLQSRAVDAIHRTLGVLDDEVRRVAADHESAASFVKGENSIAPLDASLTSSSENDPEFTIG